MPKQSAINLARAAKERAKKLFSEVPAVVGLGLTKIDDQYAVKVSLQSALPKAVKAPRTINGVPISYEIVGRIRAQ